MSGKLLALAAMLGGVGGCCCAYPPYPSTYVGVVEETASPRATAPMTLDEVFRLSKAGISEDLIVSRVRTEGLSAKPTADQIIEMKRQGVSEKVIEASIGASVPSQGGPAQPRVVYRYAPPYYPAPYPYYWGGYPGWYGSYWHYRYGW